MSDLTTEDRAALAAMQAADGDPPQADDAAQGGGTQGGEGDQGASGDAGAASGDGAGEGAAGQQNVPHGALHEERERRKAVERELADIRQQRATLEERTNLILQAIGQQQQAQQTPQQNGQALPEIDKDPVGHLVARLAQAEAALADFGRVMQSQGQQQQQQREVSELQMHAGAAEQAFAAEHPDYGAAADYLYKLRQQQLAAIGVDDPTQQRMMIAAEAQQLVRMQRSMGRNPAAAIYEQAKILGYKTPEAGNGNGQMAGDQKLQQVAAGQQQARTLSNMGGSRAAGVSARSVAEMSPGEFKAFLEKAKADPEAMRSVFGS